MKACKGPLKDFHRRESAEIYCQRISYTTRQGITIRAQPCSRSLPPSRVRLRTPRERERERFGLGFSRKCDHPTAFFMDFPIVFYSSTMCSSHQRAPMKNLLPIYPRLTPRLRFVGVFSFREESPLFCPANDRRPKRKRFNLRFPLRSSRCHDYGRLTL